ncbi:MAG TPA: TolC family protein [Woeseiaceae bacterium]|nr:TolC family protein [Woeseiaceae bacterium]
MQANPGLAAAEAAAQAAAYRIEPAGSLDDPMLSYDAAPLTAGNNRGLHQSIAVSQQIPWPGTLEAREAAARHESVAAARDADAMRLRIVAQAKSAHAEWRYIGAALDAHHGTRALLRELLATVETRYAAGDARRQDVLQTQVELADLENHLLRLAQERTTIQARINALLDRAPDAPLPPAAPLTLEAPPPSLEALKTLALVHHPELSRLNAEIAASESRITLAEKAFFPNFQVGVGYNGMWDSVDQRPMIGISINVPLDRGKRRADLDRARAEKRRAGLLLAERRAELLAELAAARAAVVQAGQSAALYRDKLVPLADQYLDATIADYRSGAGAFLNVITAEQRKLETDLEMARVLSDYARHRAELERWAGGSLETAAPAAVGVAR